MGMLAYAHPSFGSQQMCGFVDYALATPSLNQSIAKTQKLCFNLCVDQPNCTSTNYFLKTRLCALNNVSHLDLDGTQGLKMASGSFFAFPEPTVDCSIMPTTSATQTNLDVGSALNKPSIIKKQQQAYTVSSILFHHNSCKELLEAGHVVSGIYIISPAGFGHGLRVYCDMETDGGGWIVIQRRQDGSVDFYRDWADYQVGFGNLSGEFWIGNDILRNLTEKGTWQLRVNLEDWNNERVYAEYGEFQISGDNYQLTVGSYNDSSTAGDSLTSKHNGKLFSTKDRDNDNSPIGSCAKDDHGAWWYDWCYQSNLNGKYYALALVDYQSIRWDTWKEPHKVKICSMKIRSPS
ncbi:ficolin-3-like [Patiria miniata]|uniref:Fibrinogen C-terminal domain-containing protein n=1 Tax=Patiria miniata TaxID=46514 RepID=A0A914ATZ2_PATMI|nr:ficolin-3-like [Patiria miniata]